MYIKCVRVWPLNEQVGESIRNKERVEARGRWDVSVPISVVYQRKGLAETGLTEVPHRIRRAALLAERRNEDMV